VLVEHFHRQFDTASLKQMKTSHFSMQDICQIIEYYICANTMTIIFRWTSSSHS